MTTFKTILHRGAGENNVRCLDHSGRSLRFLHPVLVEREFIILPVSGTNALMAILTSSIADPTAPSAKSSLITVDVLNYTTPVMAPTLDRTSKVVIITGVTLETPLSISSEAILAFDMLGAIVLGQPPMADHCTKSHRCAGWRWRISVLCLHDAGCDSHEGAVRDWGSSMDIGSISSAKQSSSWNTCSLVPLDEP